MTYAVIMAGGSGTRFWPKSTKSLPKQFLNLFGDKTMLQNTAERVEELIPQERIIVVTNNNYIDIVKEQLPGVPAENIIGEIVAKNTAPCVAIAAELIAKKDKNGVMVVLPADHHITEPAEFRQVLRSAIQKAESGDSLVTIGINPTRPETGFGYIHANKNTEETFNSRKVLSVNGFKEKPNEEVAQQFLDSGDYFWNSGMFIWKADSVLNEISTQLPNLFKEVKKASEFLLSSAQDKAMDDFYSSCESISIDYGIMEGAKSVHVVPGSFGWNDVGSWTAVFELADKDADGNAKKATFTAFTDSCNNYVSSVSNKVIALVGVNDVAVVETESAILVCDLNSAQGVKQIVDFLKENPELNHFL